MNIKHIGAIFGAAAVAVSLVAGVARAGGGLIINELMAIPATGEKEWVELWNKGTEDIDLAGWKLTELTSPQTASSTENTLLDLLGVIPAGGLMAFDVGTTKLNNAGDSVGLYNANGIEVGRITYGTTTLFPSDVGAPSAGYSTALKFVGWKAVVSPTKNLLNRGWWQE